MATKDSLFNDVIRSCCSFAFSLLLPVFTVIFCSNFSIALTKLDVLDDLKEIKIGVAYKQGGEYLPAFPGM